MYMAKPSSRWGMFLGAVVLATGVYFQDSFFTQGKAEEEAPKKKRVVVLGAGWGTVGLLKSINPRFYEEDHYEIVVVSPRNYFLFTPLLPGCTTGTLENRSITTPIRYILEGKKYEHTFYEAVCIDVDLEGNRILCSDPSTVGSPDFTVDYDYLVVAVGSEPATFGTPGVREHTHFLKSIEDATNIRSQIVDCLETASLPGITQAERKRLLSFVVVGGGPTGCEFAGELHDFLDNDVSRFFPHLKKDISISVIQSQDVILNSFDRSIAEYAQKSMTSRENMRVLTNKRVLAVDGNIVKVVDKSTKEQFDMPFGVCVWSTGVTPVPLVSVIAKKLPNQTSRVGLIVDKHMKVKGTENVYAIGDCSVIEQGKICSRMNELFDRADTNGDGNLSFPEFKYWLKTVTDEYPQLEYLSKDLKQAFQDADTDHSGELSKTEFENILHAADAALKNLPTTAQVASQEGVYLGNELKSIAKGKKTKDFKYHQVAQFASIGKDTAIGELPFFKGGGLIVFLMWKGVYLGYQQSWSNMASVFFYWAKATLLGRDVSRH